jgi:peptide-methionine (S)-S-oxide reductase
MNNQTIDRRVLIAAALGAAVPLAIGCGRPAVARRLPDPAGPMIKTTARSEVAVFAGGCFWGIQGVFAHVKGVTKAVSGYAGGRVVNPSYEQVSSGTTGHAESVQVNFDPNQISYGQLLQIFFSVATNPTELNRQGPDEGTQYRNEIFYMSPEQKSTAEAYIAQLTAARVFPRPIVTKVSPFTNFYPAEGYHQDYAFLHPNEGYIAVNDLPKIADLKVSFPAVWRDPPIRTTLR